MDVLSYLLSKKYTDSVVSQIANFEMHVLDTLPDTGQSNIFYAIPSSELNTHDLYIWATNKGTFEKVGTTKADLTNYYNKDEVNNLIANLDVDFTGYATEEWVKGLIANLDEYAKKSELFSKDYNELINKPNLFDGDYNSLTNKPDIPSTEGLASETYVQEELAKITFPEADLSNYYNKEEIDELIENIDLPTVSLEGYATEEYVDNAIATSQKPIEEVKSTLNTTVLPKVEKVDKIESTVSELKTWVETKEYLQDINLEGYATRDYVDSAVANIEHPVKPTKVSELENDAKYTNETKVLELIENNASSKIGIDFVTDITVGHLVAGTQISKDMTISQLLYKMLFTSSQPDEPEVPEGVVDEIIYNKLPMYSVTKDGELVAEEFEIINFTQEEAAQAPTKSGFYQVINDAGEVVESGYQDMQIVNDAMYYIVALPKSVDYNSNMVKMQAYDDEEQIWVDYTKLPLTSDIDKVNELCDEAGVDISHIDTTYYTVWVNEDICTGSKLRYIIIE